MVNKLLENYRVKNQIEDLVKSRVSLYYPELPLSDIRILDSKAVKRLITSHIYQFDIYNKKAFFKTIFVKKRVFKSLYNNDITKDTVSEFENLTFFNNLPNRKFSVPRVLDVLPEKAILITEKIEGESLYSYLRRFSRLAFNNSASEALKCIFIKVGEWLREFHASGFTGKIGKIDTQDYIRKAKVIVEKFTHYGLPKSLGDSLIERMKGLEQKVLTYDFPISFKHGDFQPMNILYHQDEVFVLDIDSKDKDITIKDVTNFITGVDTFAVNSLFHLPYKGIVNELIEHFLNAYFENQPIPYPAIEFIKYLGILESLERAFKRNNYFLKRNLVSSFYKARIAELQKQESQIKNFDNASISKKIKHGIKWQFITNLIGQAVYFINGVILARIMNPKDFGIFGMSQIISNFIFVFWNLGINATIIQKKEISQEDLHTAFSISMIMGFISFAIISLFSPFISQFFKEPLVAPITILIGTTFIIYAFDRVPAALLGRNLYFKQASLIGLANPVVYGIVTIPLALMGWGPLSFAWGIIAGAIAMMLMRIYLSLKLFTWRPKFKIYKKATKDLLGFGSFLTLQSVLSFLFSDLQRIITGRFFGAVDLGYFNRASNLSSIPITKINENVGGVLLPAFSTIQTDKQKIRNWFKKFNFFTYCIISPFLIFFLFFPNELIAGVFGEKWLPSAPILLWFSLAALFSVSDIYFTNILNGIRKHKINFFIKLFAFLIFLVNMIIFLHWGIKGIAIVLFINSVVLFFIYLAVFQFLKILSLFDYLITSFEPITVSIIACIFAKLSYSFLSSLVKITEIKILTIFLLFSCILIPYYLFRWFKKSYIKYLGFDFKKITNL